jgi:hypothetical protein
VLRPRMGDPCCCGEFHHRKAAPDAGAVAPRSSALIVRIARRDVAFDRPLNGVSGDGCVPKHNFFPNCVLV